MDANNSTFESKDDLTDSSLLEEGNATSSVTGNVTVPAVRPKRIACLRREAKMTTTAQLPAETDVDYEEGGEPANLESRKLAQTQQIVEDPGNGYCVNHVLHRPITKCIFCMGVSTYLGWIFFATKATSLKMIPKPVQINIQ